MSWISGQEEARILVHDSHLLRPWRSGDAPELLRALDDAAIRRWVPLPDVLDEAAADAWIRSARTGWRRGLPSFALTRAGADETEVLGAFGFVARPEPSTVEVAYWLAARARGHGLAFRSLRALVVWAVELEICSRVLWRAESGNRRSHSVAVRAGFQIADPVQGRLHEGDGTADTWTGLYDARYG